MAGASIPLVVARPTSAAWPKAVALELLAPTPVVDNHHQVVATAVGPAQLPKAVLVENLAVVHESSAEEQQLQQLHQQLLNWFLHRHTVGLDDESACHLPSAPLLPVDHLTRLVAFS